MTIARVSSLNIHQSLLRDANQSQLDLYQLQNQISSGVKSSNFMGMRGNTEQFADLENRISRGQTYIDGAKLVESRLNIIDNTLGEIIDTATDIGNLISLRRNGAVGDTIAFQTQLDSKWQQLTSQLNVNIEGRYLFSGTATNVKAVESDKFPVLFTDGVPDDGYYQGSNEDISIRIEDSITFTYNVRANDPAFQKIFAGIAAAGKFGASGGDNDSMKQAFDYIQEGIKDVIGVRATVNANKVTVLESTARLEGLKVYWQQLKGELNDTDILAATTQVAVNQGILQASYQVFARISSLKLSDFLR